MSDKSTTTCPGCGSTETLDSLNARGYHACCPDRPGSASLIDVDGVTSTAARRSSVQEAAPATAADGMAALRWAMDEIDALSNRLTGFAYPQGMAMLDRADQLPGYEMAVAARAVAPAGVPEGKALSALQTLVGELDSLIDDSEGVSGLHRNGDIAAWSELMSDGAYPWLSSLDDARRIACARPVAELTPSGVWAPLEPTDEMMASGADAYGKEYNAYEGAIPDDVVCHSVYCAMLSAAPSAGEA